MCGCTQSSERPHFGEVEGPRHLDFAHQAALLVQLSLMLDLAQDLTWDIHGAQPVVYQALDWMLCSLQRPTAWKLSLTLPFTDPSSLISVPRFPYLENGDDAKSNRKLTFLYLANDVIQNSKRKGPEFTREFESVLVDAFSHVAREADEGCKKPLERLLNIWQERSVYGGEFIQQLKLSMEDSKSPPPKATEEKKSLKRTFQQIQEEEDDDYPGSYSPQDPSAGPLLTEELIKALQDLENAASGDATVRQKIASLPQEVQDVSLLEKITDKEAAERLSKTVDEACLLLAEYNGRLAAELEDRRQLARMLVEYTQNQKDVLSEKEKKLEEYKQKLARVTQVRKELKSHIQSLPDLSLLPNVTGGLAPLPSAGDLFSTD
uniref:Regulation of nuclear pre-mRNA domain-containing protein n=2 Tax=Boreoeutheria TaxID=1437010 RepID=A0A9L0TIH5_HORSE